MHKRLWRQINRHLGIEEESAIPTSMTAFLDAVNESYIQADHNLSLLSRTLEISSSELMERNNKLSSALEELKEAQSQLVHSAKMAGLGELVAGVSHEINTPAGAIVNAIEEVKLSHSGLLQSLLRIVQEVDPSLHPLYFEACQRVINERKERSTSEVRAISRELEDVLAPLHLTDLRSICKNLANIGFGKAQAQLLLELLKNPHHTLIQKSLFDLGMSQTHVSNIQIAIGRIIHLVKALKSYSHSESTSLTMSHLKEDINNTLVILHNKLKLGVSVVKEFEEIPPMNCFSDQLNQVWTNLINNAIDAMNGRGQIILRLKRISAHKVSVEVEDNGPGIDSSIKDKLFTPYVTTKPKGVGTGLGLSISKEIVDRHKGKIEVESRPGCTVFRVILPLDLEAIGVGNEQ